MQIEGIVIQKTPFKERDVICQLLLRSGKNLSVYIYGGRGGGKKAKGSIIEIGFMLRIELQRQKKTLETPMPIAKEYNLIWKSDHIRNNYQALCLQSFYFELIKKITVGDELEEGILEEHEGLFNVLSNALFYLDKSLEQSHFQLEQHLFLFLAKVMVQLGVNPDTENCLYCHEELKKNEFCLFVTHEGGFSCHECQTQKDEFLSDNMQLKEEFQNSTVYREQLKKAFSLTFKNYFDLEQINRTLNTMSFHYLNFQFEFKTDQYKTWKML